MVPLGPSLVTLQLVSTLPDCLPTRHPSTKLRDLRLLTGATNTHSRQLLTRPKTFAKLDPPDPPARQLVSPCSLAATSTTFGRPNIPPTVSGRVVMPLIMSWGVRSWLLASNQLTIDFAIVKISYFCLPILMDPCMN